MHVTRFKVAPQNNNKPSWACVLPSLFRPRLAFQSVISKVLFRRKVRFYLRAFYGDLVGRALCQKTVNIMKRYGDRYQRRCFFGAGRTAKSSHLYKRAFRKTEMIRHSIHRRVPCCNSACVNSFVSLSGLDIIDGTRTPDK